MRSRGTGSRAGPSGRVSHAEERETGACTRDSAALPSGPEVTEVRRFVACLLCILLCSVSALAIPLCDYRSPRTDFTSLGMSFSYQYHNDPYGLAERDVSAGRFQANYKRLFDSPEFGFKLAAKGDMTISLLGLSSFLVTADGSFRYYLVSEMPLFAFAGLNGKTASSYQTIGVSATLGVGYGRFTDVTPLAKAVMIDAYLVEHERITGHLPTADLKSIAYEIESNTTYATPTDLLVALGQLIEGTGLVKDGTLNALDISEIGHIAQDSRYVRYCGGDAELGLSYEAINPEGNANALLATVSFDYASTTTPQAQFLVQGSVSGSYDFLRTYRLDVTVGYEHRITDLLTFSSSYSFARDSFNAEPTDRHNLSLDVVLSPFPGASVSLELRLEHLPYYLEWKADVALLMSIDFL